MLESVDVIIRRVKFTEGEGSKIRSALILFEEMGNLVIAGIRTTSRLKGIPISTGEGAAQDSVIKLNYIFTITKEAIIKTVFRLSREKKQLVLGELVKRLEALKT